MKTYLLFIIYDAGTLKYYSSIYYYFNKFKYRPHVIVTNSITCSCLNPASDIHTFFNSSISYAFIIIFQKQFKQSNTKNIQFTKLKLGLGRIIFIYNYCFSI